MLVNRKATERARRGLPGPAPQASPAAPAAGLLPQPELFLLLQRWVAIENGGIKRGDVIAVDPGPLRVGHVPLGTRAIVLARADFVTTKKVLPDQVAGLYLRETWEENRFVVNDLLVSV